MLTVLVWIGSLTLLAALFLALDRLISRAQKGDPSKRGQDSSSPGNFYSDLGG